MTKKYLLNPFNAIYQDDILLSDKPEIQALNGYAQDLEELIPGEFDLDFLTSEFASNQLSFVRNGLLLAKIKFLKLYKNYGDGTFASFCKDQLRKQRWQINDRIKAARVVLDLMYAGFEILPTNISQAVALAKLGEDELVENWRRVIENIPLDKITVKSIRNLLFPPIESDRVTATIKVPAKVHEDIHQEAAERGLSIVDFIVTMFNFFLGDSSHLLQHETNTKDYAERERIWQSDLEKIVSEHDNSTKFLKQSAII